MRKVESEELLRENEVDEVDVGVAGEARNERVLPGVTWIHFAHGRRFLHVVEEGGVHGVGSVVGRPLDRQVLGHRKVP